MSTLLEHINLENNDNTHLLQKENQEQQQRPAPYNKPYRRSIASDLLASHSYHVDTISIQGYPTHVLQYPSGAVIPTSSSTTPRSDDPFDFIFVMIPGNPGVVDFYDLFLRGIYMHYAAEEEEAGRNKQAPKFGVVALGFIGHTYDSAANPRNDVYSLEEQIEHKIACVEHLRELHPKAKFIFAGHSVGSYICIQLHKRRPEFTFEKMVLMFPTIQHIAHAENYPKINILSAPGLRHIACAIVGLMGSILPMAARLRLSYFLADSESPAVQSKVAQMFKYSFLANVLFMARTEFHGIRDLDEAFVREHLHKMVFYFAAKDHWVPHEQYLDIVRRFPTANVHLDNEGVSHAFCLKHSDLMAEKVCHFIRDIVVTGVHNHHHHHLHHDDDDHQ